MKPFLLFGVYNDGKTIWDGVESLGKEQLFYLDSVTKAVEGAQFLPDAMAVSYWITNDNFAAFILDAKPELIEQSKDAYIEIFNSAMGISRTVAQMSAWYDGDMEKYKRDANLEYFERLEAIMKPSGSVSTHGDIWKLKDNLWTLQESES